MPKFNTNQRMPKGMRYFYTNLGVIAYEMQAYQRAVKGGDPQSRLKLTSTLLALSKA